MGSLKNPYFFEMCEDRNEDFWVGGYSMPSSEKLQAFVMKINTDDKKILIMKVDNGLPLLNKEYRR